MKMLWSLIKIAVIFVIITGCFFLLINKTFVYERFKAELMDGEGIPVRRFMYLINVDNGLNASFITPLGADSLEIQKENYLNSLDFCYNKFYYDSDNNITITKYNIIDNGYYRNVFITYASGNYCGNDYILKDDWMNDYTLSSTFVGGDITDKAVPELIAKISKDSRVENPIISDYNSSVSLKVDAVIEGIDYSLVFQDFSENEIVVKRFMYGVEQFAVYKMENAVNFLLSLERLK